MKTSSLAEPHPTDFRIAAEAVNALGVELYRAEARGESNVLLSPYSIGNALAMAFAGADGETRAEMQRALHFPEGRDSLDESFAALAHDLREVAAQSVRAVRAAADLGGPNTPIEFALANRLFAQRGYQFYEEFLCVAKERYDAPVEELDYRTEPENSRKIINRWVEERTRNRIRELIAPGGINGQSRLSLINALYLRAPWAVEFPEKATKLALFLVRGREDAIVPTMVKSSSCGYARHEAFQLITRPYYGGQLQFVIVLPDQSAGLAAVERQLAADLLADFARLPSREVLLHLPRFRVEPPTMALGGNLKALGMKTAFDVPKGSANFDRMAPRIPDDYLYIGEVYHKTYLALDEKGTEAAAATAVAVLGRGGTRPNRPLEVRVDHPFIFAIQHVPSGACLFLGRVTDPREGARKSDRE